MSFSFNAGEGLIVVQTTLTGPLGSGVANLALDTGAIMTVVSNSVLLDMGYDPFAASEQVEVTTGSGVVVVPQIEISRIEALGQEQQNFLILCHSFPPSATVNGVLGLDFLRDKRLVLDFRTGILTLD